MLLSRCAARAASGALRAVVPRAVAPRVSAAPRWAAEGRRREAPAGGVVAHARGLAARARAAGKGKVYLGADDEDASLEGEEPFFEDDNFGEDEEEGFDLAALEDDEELPGVHLGDAAWAPAALACVERVLKDDIEGDLTIFSLGVDEARRALALTIDKPSDKWGAPSVDEIVAVARVLNEALDVEAEAGRVPAETAAAVSSPGAERAVTLPEELSRFGDMPMQLTFDDAESGTTLTQIMAYVPPEEDTQEVGDDATWKLAEVKANRGEKNRPMTRKQRNLRWQIAFGDITKANLHLDV